jgi:hypothetical protein
MKRADKGQAAKRLPNSERPVTRDFLIRLFAAHAFLTRSFVWEAAESPDDIAKTFRRLTAEPKRGRRQ